MKIVYRICTALAIGCTTIPACLSPESAPEPVGESMPPFDEEASSGGGTTCVLSSSCTVNREPGKCAVSPTTGALMCCIGCIDSGGYCRTSSQMTCGLNGSACVECGLQHATASCISGSCNIASCDSGWEDCDSNVMNGCETSVSNDVLNCGGCQDLCAPGQSCAAGACY